MKKGWCPKKKSKNNKKEGKKSIRRRQIEWTYTRMYIFWREREKPLRISGSVRGEVACVEEEEDEE